MGWVLAGIFLSFFLVLRDVYFYIKLLSMHRGCKEYNNMPDELAEDPMPQNIEIVIINEARETVIDIYHEIKWRITKEMEGKEKPKIAYEELNILEMIEEDTEKL